MILEDLDGRDENDEGGNSLDVEGLELAGAEPGSQLPTCEYSQEQWRNECQVKPVSACHLACKSAHRIHQDEQACQRRYFFGLIPMEEVEDG